MCYLCNLKEACVHDPFLIPFIDEVLEKIEGIKVYSFTDGFSSYHKVKIVEEEIHKTTFRT